ncbi:methyltransferase domain-containing protein [Alteromonas oceanisediminis]|uniref:methyltransferase domain-containing protein n=1 Tax=Alteromonas oceanisediminis TaxID=2836180 RepID=UPI001BDA64C0|nr:methyltransferase domain-containing protein [Alteromonas oceanisediminis]MBT0587630.1 methyltransferase domain-containing protein [Alteromonas oceanisediminis]
MNKRAVGQCFSRGSEVYDARAAVQQDIARYLTTLSRTDPPSSQGLDLGCGTGYLSRMCHPAEQWVGIDIAFGMVEKSVRNSQRSHEHVSQIAPLFIHADAEALPFADAQFSRVVSSMALQWVSSPMQCATELARVLAWHGIARLAILSSPGLPELAHGWAYVDQRARLNQFPAMATWADAFKRAKLHVVDHHTKPFVTLHSDIFALLHSINDIGAGTLQQNLNKPLTRATLRELSAWWQQYHSTPQGLRLTYQVDFWHLQKG